MQVTLLQSKTCWLNRLSKGKLVQAAGFWTFSCIHSRSMPAVSLRRLDTTSQSWILLLERQPLRRGAFGTGCFFANLAPGQECEGKHCVERTRASLRDYRQASYSSVLVWMLSVRSTKPRDEEAAAVRHEVWRNVTSNRWGAAVVRPGLCAVAGWSVRYTPLFFELWHEGARDCIPDKNNASAVHGWKFCWRRWRWHTTFQSTTVQIRFGDYHPVLADAHCNTHGVVHTISKSSPAEGYWHQTMVVQDHYGIYWGIDECILLVICICLCSPSCKILCKTCSTTTTLLRQTYMLQQAASGCALIVLTCLYLVAAAT